MSIAISENDQHTAEVRVRTLLRLLAPAVSESPKKDKIPEEKYKAPLTAPFLEI